VCLCFISQQQQNYTNCCGTSTFDNYEVNSYNKSISSHDNRFSEILMRTFTPEEKQFISEHLQDNTAQLMLQAKRYSKLPVLDLVQQIQARQKAAAKLPLWATNMDVVFPVSVSVEQSSSEITALFKASLVKGNLLIDLTGGFGVDSFFFSKQFEKVIHIEQNITLQEVASYNFKLLGASNIESMSTSAEKFIQQYEGKANVIFLDPARRGESNEKLHLLQECEPDVLNLLPALFQKSETVLLKTSPMLDIDLAIEQLGCVHKLWIVAVQNEVKEVLYLLKPSKSVASQIERVAINLLSGGENQQLHFTKEVEETAQVTFSDAKTYMYEPNSAILKAGGYKVLAQKFQIDKLHPNSHLYTSENLVSDFPGRKFKCLGTFRYSKKELLRLLPSNKANITVRNFPESVAEIRKKTGIKEGGNDYLFFTTDMHQKPIVLFCHKA
jgi:hypothetical protein